MRNLNRCLVLSPPMFVVPDPAENRLLAALPEAEARHWLTHLEPVEMPQGMVLHEADVKPTHAYFPTTAVASLMYVLEEGLSPEIATIGNDGVVGVSLFMAGDSTPSRAVVLSAGHGFRIAAQAIAAEFHRSPHVMRVLLRYAQALMTQMGQTGVCNRHHSVAQQLCRWLLLNMDRLPGKELAMTQESIAHVLGARREAISDVASKLQDAGVIRYTRGHIIILDRRGLEERACACYSVVKNEYDRLLPPKLASVGSVFKDRAEHQEKYLRARPAGREGLEHSG
jgi:CRP-like cAMP-binding protein